MLAALLLLTAPETEIALELPATRSGLVVQQLAEMTGQRLSVSTELAGEPLVLRVDGQPLDSVLARIAHVMHAQWQRDESGARRLVRPPDLSQRLKRQQLEDRARLVRPAIDSFVKNALPDQEWDAHRAESLLRTIGEMSTRYEANPGAGSFEPLLRAEHRLVGGRATARLLREIDPLELAALEPGRRLVFSMDPGPRQLPLRAGRKALELFVKEHAELVEAVRRNSGRSGISIMRLGGGTSYYEQPLPEAPSRLMLVVRNLHGQLDLAMTLAGDSGTVLFTARASLGSAYAPQMEPPPVPGWLPDDARFTYRPESLAHAGALSMRMDRHRDGEGTNPSSLPPALLEHLLAPERFDPLSFHVTDELLAIARPGDSNLVARVPDAMLGGSLLDEKSVAVRDAYVALRWQCEVSRVDDWTIVRPIDPLEAERRRVHRGALGEFVDDVRRRGLVRLALAARFAARHPLQDGLMLADRYRQSFGLAAAEGGFGDWALRWYGTLSADQQTMLDAGGALPLDRLAPEQRAALDEGLYTAADVYLYRHLRLPDGSRGLRTEWVSEPTNEFPGALPPGALVSLRLSMERQLLWSRNGLIAGRSPAEVGAWVASAETGSIAPVPSRFWVGSRRMRTIELALPYDLRLSRQLPADYEVDLRQRPVPITSLPEEVRSAIASAAEEARKRRLPSPPVKQPPPTEGVAP
jgi:hypothetical protein